MKNFYRKIIPANIRYRFWEIRTYPIWLFDPQARRSRKHLAELKDKHLGERCFIIGNGPSLKKTNMGLLSHETTFGLNRIYLLAKKIPDFLTTYHVIVNPLVIEQFIHELRSVSSIKFVNWNERHLVKSEDADLIYLRCAPRPQFSTDPTQKVWIGATVTYVAMQLAFYMGFQKVILIGVDHNFHTKGPAHKVITNQEEDDNHFDAEYFGKGAKWQLPDIITSEKAFHMAKFAFEEYGREIVDATIDGKLQVFRKVEYLDLFQNKK
jgi:hypothetical protein